MTRAKVQLSNEKQRLLAVQNERAKAYLQLLRVMGLNLATELELTDKLSYEPTEAISVEQAKAEALKNRPDIKAQAEREAAARLSAEAVKLRAASQSVRLCGLRHYGDQRRHCLVTCPPGTTASLCACRFSMAAGGTPGAPNPHRSSARSASRTNDLHEQMELDVRTALDSSALRRRAVQSRRGRV